MSRTFRLALIVAILSCSLLPGKVSSGGIADTKHNLSVTGPGPVKSTTEGELCIFCHVPHNARRDIPYLWNRADSTANYVPYASSTLKAAVGQPTGASKLCLSCHDGTIALGALVTRPQEIPFAGGVRFLPEGRTKLGTDLSDDHPVSFVYDAALAAGNGELADPSVLPAQVRRDRNGEMQCTACHDPHDNAFGKFLVMSNRSSALCTVCHEKTGWPSASHSTSGKTWNGQGTNPWFDSPYPTVAENGCGNCHVSHTAGGRERLLHYAVDEDNCLVCHTGNVAAKNIGNELTKPYGHFVQNYAGVHDPAESFTAGSGVRKHVECADCHNGHRSDATASPGAPQVSGATAGVAGIDASGQSVASSPNQYEICFKCHGDTNFITTLSISRQIPQLNTLMEFSPLNPSFHPVAGQGVNPNVPSLIPPLTTTSRIFCTDCHGNDAPAGPKGPHGSTNNHLLAKNYSTADNFTESAQAYELCYTCHSRTSILSDRSFKEHKKHIVDEKAPCSACHDPHGVSNTQGNPTNNSHLINFDLNIVQPDRNGNLRFEDQGTFKGRCYLNCHGENHNPEGY